MTDGFEERLARLEGEARGWRAATLVATAVACALAVYLALGGRVGGEYRARAFVLEDAAGAELGRMSAEPDGARLTLRAPRAGVDVVLGAYEEHAGLALRGEHVVWANLSVSEGGRLPGLSLANGAGRTRVLVGVDSKGDAAAALWSADGKLRWVARPSEDRPVVVEGPDEKDTPPATPPVPP